MINKKLSITYVIVIVLSVTYVEAKFSNIPQPVAMTRDAATPSNRCRCIDNGECTSCPVPPTTAPTPTQPPMPLPPICTQTGSSLSLYIMDSCNNCSDPNCSTAPDGSMFPYPNHCQFFWKCTNQVPVICYCPNGMWYDRVRKVCDYCPNVINCPANTN